MVPRVVKGDVRDKLGDRWEFVWGLVFMHLFFIILVIKDIPRFFWRKKKFTWEHFGVSVGRLLLQ